MESICQIDHDNFKQLQIPPPPPQKKKKRKEKKNSARTGFELMGNANKFSLIRKNVTKPRKFCFQRSIWSRESTLFIARMLMFVCCHVRVHLWRVQGMLGSKNKNVTKNFFSLNSSSSSHLSCCYPE